MNKQLRILGKRGRITIPYAIRQRVGFAYNDVLSFTEQDDRTVVVRRERLCDSCAGQEAADTMELEGLPRRPVRRTAKGGAGSFVCKIDRKDLLRKVK